MLFAIGFEFRFRISNHASFRTCTCSPSLMQPSHYQAGHRFRPTKHHLYLRTPHITPHSPGRSHHCSHPHFCTPTEIQTSSFNLHATASNFQRKLHARHTTHTTLSIAVGHARTMNGMCGSRLHQARSENRTSTCMQQHQTCKLQQKLHARRLPSKERLAGLGVWAAPNQ